VENDEDFAEYAGAAHDLDPKSLKAALRRSDKDKWQDAAQLEIDNHVSNGTWELVDLPPGAKCINSGWYFVSNAMQMVLSNATKLVSSQKATVNVLALITLKSSLPPSDMQPFALLLP